VVYAAGFDEERWKSGGGTDEEVQMREREAEDVLKAPEDGMQQQKQDDVVEAVNASYFSCGHAAPSGLFV